MRKVSILSLHMGFGGIEKSVCALANLLCDKYDVEIGVVYKLYEKEAFKLDERVKVKYLSDVVPNKEEFKEALRNKKVKDILKEGITSVKVLRTRKKCMVDYIKTCGSDIIISTRDVFDEWLGEYGPKTCLKIGWEHNHHHGNMDYARKIAKSCKKLDYLVLVSKDLKEFYSELMKNTSCSCVYIPNIIDEMPSKKSKLKEKRLISVGRLSSEKGFMDLLKVYNRLKDKYSDWSLDIIGDGNEKKKLETFIETNKLDNVTLHGFRDKEYIDKMLDKSSIYLMTSYTESFGIVLIEAMSHGVPCIAYDSAEGAKELINSGENGYLIHNRNIDAYVKKVEDLIESYEDRKRIGDTSYIFAKQFTGDEVVKHWIEVLEV